jgi:general secretion pathway protein E
MSAATSSTSTPEAPAALGDLLVARGLIDRADVDRALVVGAGRLGERLLRAGALAESDLIATLADQLGWPVAADVTFGDRAAILAGVAESALPLGWWRDRSALPVLATAGAVTIATADPLASGLADVARIAFAGRRIAFAVVAPSTFARVIADLGGPAAVAPVDEDGDAPAIRWLDGLLSDAERVGASDLHLEPDAQEGHVRFRLDGVMRPRATVARPLFDAAVARAKLLGGLDLGERRLPQDGRMTRRLAGRPVDIRVSTLPGRAGESLVLRLLGGDRVGEGGLAGLGMDPPTAEAWLAAARRTGGILLVTGPTGSGKSTTLYATLEALQDGRERIVTVEEPVERVLPGINQVAANTAIGYGFAEALRALLRQDPDRVMVGEIRDGETARVAFQAAMTGHAVYSTLHTETAVGAITRLLDLGVEPYLIQAGLRGVLAQRLLRRPCPACGGRGCAACAETGHRGRIGLFAWLPIGPALAPLIAERASVGRLEAAARVDGHRDLADRARDLVAAGLTTEAEVARVLGTPVAA